MKHPFMNAHIVLDMPDPVASKVMELRRKYKDTFRVSLPVEVTLTGSSGVGVLLEEQSPEMVYQVIDQIACKTKPIETSLGNVIRFPNTDIFAFEFTSESIITALHRELANSTIKFHPNLFPYKPHCTIRSISPVSREDEQELASTVIKDKFVLDTVSVYSLLIDQQGEVTLPLLHKVKLTG